jgi:hypothetical protein
MSVASMTEVALQRRSDVGTPHYVPRTLRQIAGAASGKETPDTALNTALKVIVTYIPIEVITLYLSIVASLQPSPGDSAAMRTPPVAFWAFLAFTPLATWLIYAGKVKNAGKRIPIALRAWPVWEMIAGTLAFSAWALALPEQPFPWIRSALAAVFVLITSTLLGLLAPLFTRRINP